MMPPAILAQRGARSTELQGWIGLHKKSFWCKFHDLGSVFSRSNDVTNAKVSSFFVKPSP